MPQQPPLAGSKRPELAQSAAKRPVLRPAWMTPCYLGAFQCSEHQVATLTILQPTRYVVGHIVGSRALAGRDSCTDRSWHDIACRMGHVRGLAAKSRNSLERGWLEHTLWQDQRYRYPRRQCLVHRRLQQRRVFLLERRPAAAASGISSGINCLTLYAA